MNGCSHTVNTRLSTDPNKVPVNTMAPLVVGCLLCCQTNWLKD